MGTPRESLPREHTASILGTVSRNRTHSLRFGETEKGPLAQRDYGLMRVSSIKARTPYPRVEKGVDAEVLRARLKDRRQSTASGRRTDEFPEVMIEKIQLVKLMDTEMLDKLREEQRERLLLGTPHPKKGNALDPKMLIKRLKFTTPAPPRRHSLETDASSRNSRKSSKQPTIARKGLMRRCKKRVLINPQHHSIDDMDPVDETFVQNDIRFRQLDDRFPGAESGHSFFDSRTSFQTLDFEERRRKFDEAEFTIAKKGKRIGEAMMGETKTAGIVEQQSWFGSDKRAKEEIEKFIIKQGLVKTRNDQLTLLRPQSRLSHFGDHRSGKGNHYARSSQASLRSISSLKSPRFKSPH